MDIQLVLEVSVIATLISAGMSYLTFRKSSSLTYVTQERKEWREAIRRIAEELETCPYENRKHVLVQLKTRINAYGLDSTEVLDDEHIWRLIQQIELCTEKEYGDLKNQLILYLSLLLKYDWERSKKEVHGEPWQIIGNMFAVAALVFLEIGLYQISKDAVPGLEMALFLLGIVFVFSKTKKETRKNNLQRVLLYSALPLGGLIILAVVPCVEKSEILSQQYISLSIIAAYFSAAIQLLVDLTDVFERHTYECCINKISGGAIKSKWLKWIESRGEKMSRKKRIFNAWKGIIIGVVLVAPQIALLLCMKYGISDNIGIADKLSLHIATGSLSVAIIIALLVYWLQKSDASKEQLHRQSAAKTAMRYAIENGIRWMLGADDGMLGTAATIKETANHYRQELLDVLTEQEYNEMILVVEGINDAIAASRDEDVDALVTEDNRARMFRPWINTIRWSRYHSYLAMAGNYHDLLSEMMIHLLHALGGTYIFEQKMRIYDKNQKTFLELSGEKITIHLGEDLVLEGTFRVEETTYTAQFYDGWAKNDEYVGYYKTGERNGQGCSYGITGEKLKEGIWEKGELQTGVEYSCLIHVDQGELIYNAEENDYDSSDDLEYSVYEQYGMNIIPFMESETYIVHEGLSGFYVADLKIENDMWQPENIQTLEQYLVKKNPGRLTELKKMIEL